MAKKVDPLKAKQKRQKVIAAVGGVVLLGLLAFQVPRVMKQLNKKPPAPPVASTTTAPPSTGTPSLAAPTLAGSAQPASATASAPTSGDGVTTGDGTPAAQEGQLTSFSRFASKDPFAQQLADTSGTSTASPSGYPSTRSGGNGSLRAPTTGGGSVPTSSGGTGSKPAPGGAVISVNGRLVNVTVGTDFPAAGSDPNITQPLFHLVSVTAHSAKISIVGGSYANGAATVTLRENKPVTLMNTADGTRYKLVLKPQGAPVPSATPTATTPSP
jgi:hypothetical protein